MNINSIGNRNAIVKIEAYTKESIRYYKKNGDARVPHLKIFTK